MDFKSLLDHYGYIVLFAGLMLELIALPVPGEALMTYCGLLVFEGRLNWITSTLLAWGGASVGITIAYWIGFKAGTPFFEKYGRKIHLGPDKLAKASQWFQRYGNKVIMAGFFIPGVRHITGYFAGITRISFRTFGCNAYLGALLYTGIFISLGKLLGPEWERFHQSIKKYLIIAGVIAVVVVLVIYLYRRYKEKIFAFVKHLLAEERPVRLLVIGGLLAFLGFFALMVGMIQDVLAQEFLEFDTVTVYVVHAMIDLHGAGFMQVAMQAASYAALVPVVALTLAWVARKGRDRRLEVVFLLIVFLGGGLLGEGLRRVFQRPGPVDAVYTFPSPQTLIVLAVYGFCAFLFVRHYGRATARILSTLAVVVVALLVGGSCVYFDLQYPSDVAGGYVFGGVWLSLNIILLEIFRQLRMRRENMYLP